MPPRLFAFLRSALKSDNALGLLLSALALAVYLTTLAPGLGFIDTGELAAVAATFGIAHPTGYPLFTLVAGAFAKLPIGDTVIWRLNLFAALCCTASVFFFFRVFLALLGAETRAGKAAETSVEKSGEKSRFEQSAPKKTPWGSEGETFAMQRAAAAIGALTLAFSRVFWEQSTGVEVYSLQLLMVSLVLFFFVRATSGPSRLPNRAEARAWILFAFCLGLSFANHMTTVLLLPGLAWFFFAVHGFSRSAWMQILRGLPAFFAGLSLYLYLPLRAAAGPLMNWGNPVTLENFWRHVTGKQYSIWMFSSVDVALRQLDVFADSFPAIFGYAALVPMVVGMVALWSKRSGHRIAAFTTLLFITCVLYAINYDIHDIETYFLLAEIAAAFWITRGVLAALMTLPQILPRPQSSRKRTKVLFVVVVGAACVLPPLFSHYHEVDESDNYVVEDYARNMFQSLGPNATLLTYQWDHFVAASYYLQRVEGLRPDVTVLDRELLRRSWYLVQLEASHPELVAESRVEIDAFLRVVRPFERGETYDGTAIQTAFVTMIRALMLHAGARGPLYCTSEIEPEYLQGFHGVPAGLAFRLYVGDSVPEITPSGFSIRPFPKPPKDGPLFQAVRAAYAAAYVNHAFYQGSLGNLAVVRPLLDQALTIRPGYPQALELLRRLEGGQ